MIEHPIEGWILFKAGDGYSTYWKVSGYEHPEHQAIVVPYRVGAIRVDATARIPGARLSYIPCIGRIAYTISLDEVEWVDPHRIFKYRLKDLKYRKPKIVEMIDILSPEWIGLTGSWAVLHETPKSDVDILIYDKDDNSFYRTLVDLKEEGKIIQCQGKYYINLPRIYEYQLLDACFVDEKYTIRILETLEIRSCMKTSVPLGWIESGIRIIEPVAPHRVPAYYKAEVNGLGHAILETWHTRYQELAPGSYRAKLQVFYTPYSTIVSPDLGGWIKSARKYDFDK